MNKLIVVTFAGMPALILLVIVITHALLLTLSTIVLVGSPHFTSFRRNHYEHSRSMGAEAGRVAAMEGQDRGRLLRRDVRGRNLRDGQR
jgi:hypothetical protein